MLRSIRALFVCLALLSVAFSALTKIVNKYAGVCDCWPQPLFCPRRWCNCGATQKSFRSARQGAQDTLPARVKVGLADYFAPGSRPRNAGRVGSSEERNSSAIALRSSAVVLPIRSQPTSESLRITSPRLSSSGFELDRKIDLHRQQGIADRAVHCR